MHTKSRQKRFIAHHCLIPGLNVSPDLTELESESELESEAESQFEDDTTGIILAVIGEEDEPQTTNVPIVEHAREDDYKASRNRFFRFLIRLIIVTRSLARLWTCVHVY